MLQTSLAVKSTVSGTITALLVEDGTTVTPGTPLVTIAVGEGGAAPPPTAAAKGRLFFSADPQKQHCFVPRFILLSE